MDDAAGKFSIFALRFLRALLNWYIRIHFGMLSLKIKVLYEFVLLCPDTNGVLLKAVCLCDFWLTSTGILLKMLMKVSRTSFLLYLWLNFSHETLFRLVWLICSKYVQVQWQKQSLESCLFWSIKWVSRGRYSEGNLSFLNQTIQSNPVL